MFRSRSRTRPRQRHLVVFRLHVEEIRGSITLVPCPAGARPYDEAEVEYLRREILRAREEFCRLFFDPTVSPSSAEGLNRYFLAFAMAARRRTAPG